MGPVEIISVLSRSRVQDETAGAGPRPGQEDGAGLPTGMLGNTQGRRSRRKNLRLHPSQRGNQSQSLPLEGVPQPREGAVAGPQCSVQPGSDRQEG